MDLLLEKWPEILDFIKKEYDIADVSFKIWLKPLKVHDVTEKEIILLIDTDQSGMDFITIIKRKYEDAIKIAIEGITGLHKPIRFILPKDIEETDSSSDFSSVPNSLQLAIEEAHLNPKYSFDTFVVGSNNKFAHAASLAVAESPGEIYNPLFLYAGVGLGKTHLMHSIAHFILQNDPGKKVLYVTSEEFTNELIDSIRNGNNTAMSKFREKYRNIDVLLIDDIQFIIGKESTQEEFFHTFNSLHSNKKQIIVSSDKPPKDMEILEDRIRSRFEWGLIADISLPDYETRVAILRKKLETDGFKISDEVIDYIASNIKSNIRELEGSLNKIRAKGVLDKRDINVELAEEVLRDIISPNEKKEITPTLIIDVIASHYGVTVSDIKGKKRNSKIVLPRQITMYLCRSLTNMSLIQIAEFLGKNDHSTIISGCQKIEKELEKNTALKDDLTVIKKKLNPNL